jgi:hypothetical protein
MATPMTALRASPAQPALTPKAALSVAEALAADPDPVEEAEPVEEEALLDVVEAATLPVELAAAEV